LNERLCRDVEAFAVIRTVVQDSVRAQSLDELVRDLHARGKVFVIVVGRGQECDTTRAQPLHSGEDGGHQRHDAVEVLSKHIIRNPLQVAEEMEQIDAEAHIVRQLADFSYRRSGVDQVDFENFDTVESGGGDVALYWSS
jgi:hypothetical protein